MPAASSPHDAEPARTLATSHLPTRVRKVLEKTFAVMSDELERNLAAMLEDYEQQLFRMADHARNPGVESSYMETLRTMRLHRADLAPRFMQALESGLASIRSAPRATVAPAAPVTYAHSGLSLVEQTVMDEGTVLYEIATRAESRVTLAIHLLGQRFGVLAGAPGFDAERLPIGPQALCRAMRDASRGLDIDQDARLLLYRVFERKVIGPYVKVVELLDQALAADGILPHLTYVPTRFRANAPADETAEQPKPAASTRARPPHTKARDGDAQRPHVGWTGQPATPEDEEEDAAQFAVLQQLLSGRRGLIEKLRPQRAGGNARVLERQELDRELGVLQSAPVSPTGTPRNLADVKQTLLAQARQRHGQGAKLAQDDDDTIELLGLLYNQIEGEVRDDTLAAALLRRLQVPLLRAALKDRGVFVRANHPARQLLNTVAETGAKWLHEDDLDPRMVAPLQSAVNNVVERYDEDPAVFETSNRQLQEQLEVQARKAEMLERRHVEAARGKERLEIAKIHATRTLKDVTSGARLPKFVQALLNQAWNDVLTLTLLRHGEESEEWREQLDASRKIVAACTHGGVASEDASLRSHIEGALGQVGYHAEEAAAIALRLTSNVSDEDDPASRTELTMKLKARARLGEEPPKTEKVVLPPRNAEEQARYEQLRVLPFGAWLEFVVNQQGDVVRRRMSWFSPITDKALFVNQRGQRVAEYTLDSLARMLASGQARIVTVERARLVDRAWQATLNALRSFAGREPAGAGARA